MASGEGDSDGRRFRLERGDPQRFLRLRSLLWCVGDDKGHFIEMSPAWEDVLKTPLDELIGRRWTDLIHPDDVESTIAVAASGRETGEIGAFENRYRTADGGYRWIAWDGHYDTDAGLFYAVGQDVTERREAERHLHRSQERLERAGEIAGLGTWELNITTGEAWWSDSLLMLCGLARDDVTDDMNALLHCMPEGEQQRVSEAYRRSIVDGSRLDVVHRVRRQDGEIRVVHVQADHARNEAGHQMLLGTTHDITDVQRARAEAEASEARSSSILAASPVAIAVLDADCRVVGPVNRSFVNLFGFDAESGAGMELDDAGLWIEEGVCETVLAGLRERGRVSNAPYTAVTPRGPRRVLINVEPVILDGERHLLMAVSDIHDRVEAERRARHFDELLRAVLQSIPIVVYALDADEHITFSEGRGLAALGLEPGQRVGESARALFGDAPFQRIGGETVPGGDILDAVLRRGETVVCRSDQGGVILEHYLSPRPESPGRRSAVGVSIDVTEQVELARKLARSQQLESLGRLAGGIAHDFNNMLTIIIGFARMVHQALPVESDLREDMREVIGAGERAAALTRHLLAFGRRQVLEPRAVEVAELVAGLERLLRRVLGEGVEFVVDTPPGLPTIWVDPAQLEQVIINLILNARDATRGNGKVSLRTALREVVQADRSELEPGSYLSLEVTDDGTGMDEETRRKAIEPFFTTKGKGGTGLGLSNAYGILKQSGGDLQIDSALGEGTTVTLWLPRADRRSAPRHHTPQIHTVHGSETILVVDDDAGVAYLAARILANHGYHVLRAASGEDALEVFESSETVDLVVSDVVMPGIDGVELLDRIAPVPGVLMTGYADIDSRIGEESERHVLIHKPFRAEHLLRTVRDALDLAGRD